MAVSSRFALCAYHLKGYRIPCSGAFDQRTRRNSNDSWGSERSYNYLLCLVREATHRVLQFKRHESISEVPPGLSRGRGFRNKRGLAQEIQPIGKSLPSGWERIETKGE